VSLGRCGVCSSIIDTDDDPEATGQKHMDFMCAFCRGDETYEEATERQSRLYRAMGAKWLKRVSVLVSRSRYT
jgi:hypothetical protein